MALALFEEEDDHDVGIWSNVRTVPVFDRVVTALFFTLPRSLP